MGLQAQVSHCGSLPPGGGAPGLLSRMQVQRGGTRAAGKCPGGPRVRPPVPRSPSLPLWLLAVGHADAPLPPLTSCLASLQLPAPPTTSLFSALRASASLLRAPPLPSGQVLLPSWPRGLLGGPQPPPARARSTGWGGCGWAGRQGLLPPPPSPEGPSGLALPSPLLTCTPRMPLRSWSALFPRCSLRARPLVAASTPVATSGGGGHRPGEPCSAPWNLWALGAGGQGLGGPHLMAVRCQSQGPPAALCASPLSPSPPPVHQGSQAELARLGFQFGEGSGTGMRGRLGPVQGCQSEGCALAPRGAAVARAWAPAPVRLSRAAACDGPRRGW